MKLTIQKLKFNRNVNFNFKTKFNLKPNSKSNVLDDCCCNVTCFHIFYQGLEINYDQKNKSLDQIGKNKIIEIVKIIEKLEFNYLSNVIIVNTIYKILEEMKTFPYVEIFPVIIEMLNDDDIKFHQIYIILKILESILNSNKVLLCIPLNNICSKIMNVLFKIYFKHFIFQDFILHIFKLFLQNKIKGFNKEQIIKYLLKIVELEGKSVLFYYSVLKIFEGLTPSNLPLKNEIYEKIKIKIQNSIAKTEFEIKIKQNM